VNEPRESIQAACRRLNQLAWLLDSSIAIPGTGFTIGLDALIGLVPVLGDAIGVLLSGYIVAECARLGVSKSVLMRMAVNIAVEGLVGALPLVGDLFDAAWKANQKNVRLLNAYVDRPGKTAASSSLFLLFLAALFALLLAAIGAAGFLILRWIGSLASPGP
jgi:uncharacterized protein DUF4112